MLKDHKYSTLPARNPHAEPLAPLATQLRANPVAMSGKYFYLPRIEAQELQSSPKMVPDRQAVFPSGFRGRLVACRLIPV